MALFDGLVPVLAGQGISKRLPLWLMPESQAWESHSMLTFSGMGMRIRLLRRVHFLFEMQEIYSGALASTNVEHSLVQVAEDLRMRVLALYDKHLAPDGRAVDYKGLGADPDFRTFVDATAELQKVDMSALSREERMAFWINIYNILVVHIPFSKSLHIPQHKCSVTLYTYSRNLSGLMLNSTGACYGGIWARHRNTAAPGMVCQNQLHRGRPAVLLKRH